WSRTSPSGNGGSRLPCVFRPLCLLWKRPDYRLTLEWASIFNQEDGVTHLGWLNHLWIPPWNRRPTRRTPRREKYSLDVPFYRTRSIRCLLHLCIFYFFKICPRAAVTLNILTVA